MDILIKNMELPKSCYSDEFKYCPFLFFDYDTKSHCELSDEIRCTKTRRPKDCPLVELPPHGRLGDLDELEKLAEKMVVCDSYEYTIAHEMIKKLLEIAPTVLEAST